MNKQYIKYNIGDYDGCGVIIENFFFTAGHNFDNGDFVFEHGGKTIKLSKDDAMLISTFEKTAPYPNGYDVAFFHLDDIESPVRLSTMKLKEGDVLKCIHYHRISGNNEKFDEIECTVVEKIEGNYFLCSLEKTLDEISGSLVLDANGNLIGLLGAENKEIGKCIYLTSSAIGFLWNFIYNTSRQINDNLLLTTSKLLEFWAEYVDLTSFTSFSSAPAEKQEIYKPLNAREVFACLTKMEIPEPILHDCILQIDESGLYFDEIFDAISKLNYELFKEILRSKNCSLYNVSQTLLDFIIKNHPIFLQLEPNENFIRRLFVVSIELGFIPEDEIEIFYRELYNIEEKDVYNLSHYYDHMLRCSALNRAHARIILILKRIFEASNAIAITNKRKEYEELFSDSMFEIMQEASQITEEELFNIGNCIIEKKINVDSCIYEFAYTYITKLDELREKSESLQGVQNIADNDVSADQDSTQDKREAIVPVVDFCEIFASQAPNVDYKTMRAIAVKLAAKESNMNTDSQSAYIRPIDVARFCYFFLHEINVPDCIDKVDFSYPIQWLGGWESLKYFIIKLYEFKSLPSNLGEEVVKAFRFRKLRNKPGKKGVVEETTFNHSYHQDKVGEKNIKRINSILREFNL